VKPFTGAVSVADLHSYTHLRDERQEQQVVALVPICINFGVGWRLQ
jgi:hypothetical protein